MLSVRGCVRVCVSYYVGVCACVSYICVGIYQVCLFIFFVERACVDVSTCVFFNTCMLECAFRIFV